MQQKKILFTIALSLVAAILSLSVPAKAANLNLAAGTLPQNDEWSVMARASLGQNSAQAFLRFPILNGSATDYEKRILAITALGENPQTYGQENFISKLELFFDGNQIGDSSLLNDDIFGVLAFYSAGTGNNITSKSRQFILSHQNADGGWGFGTSVGSDSNTTAMAVAALSKTGSVPASAFDYLASTENSSGGYSFIPNTSADGASTAWVIMGLNSANKKTPTSAVQFLEQLQTPNGSFKWKTSDNSGSQLVTAYAIIALSGNGMPIKTISNTNPAPLPPPTPAPTPTPAPIPSPSNEIQLCSDINFGGICENLINTDPDLRNNLIGNDTTSSIRIPIGKKAALYEHINFQGKCEEFQASDSDFRDNNIGNDTVSSISIVTACPLVIAVPPPMPVPAPAPIPAPAPAPVPAPSPNLPPPPVPGSTNTVHMTITYPGNNIFAGEVILSSNQSAMTALESAAHQINLLYEIKPTVLGNFVQSIDGYANSGINGWQYAVNGTVPLIGAGDYALHNQDLVQWFYGTPNSSPF